MADDPLDPPTPPASEPRAEPRAVRSGVVCLFCECKLDSQGEPLIIGGKAKKYRDLSEKNDTLSAQVTSLTAEVERLKQSAAPPTPERKSGLRI